MDKKFKLQASDMENLTDLPGFCFATDDITVNGKPVGYMYREHPDDPQDSGWRFFSGGESEEQANDPNFLGLYKLNTIANYDRSILPFLDSVHGKAFGKNADGTFVEEPFESET